MSTIIYLGSLLLDVLQSVFVIISLNLQPVVIIMMNYVITYLLKHMFNSELIKPLKGYS